MHKIRASHSPHWKHLALCALLAMAPCVVRAAPGDLDTTFADGVGRLITPGENYARAVAIQANGKIVVAGSAGADFTVLRYNAAGPLDTTFGGSGKATVPVGAGFYQVIGRAPAIQPDGKILIVGSARDVSLSQQHVVLMRLTPTGNLDSAFGGGTGKVVGDYTPGDDIPCGAVVLGNGKIVVAGTAGGDFFLARYNASGSPDSTFNGNGRVITPIGTSADEARGMVLQPDGKIVVVGASFTSSSDDRFAIVRYNADGTLDNTFGGTGKVVTPLIHSSDYYGAVALQLDGKIVAVVRAVSGGSAVARYNTNGTLDSGLNGTGIVETSFGTGYGHVTSVVLQTNGKIVVGGTSGNGPNGLDFALLRLLDDGVPDTSFNGTGIVLTPIGPGHDECRSLALQTDGKIVAAGTSSGSDVALARFLGDPLAPEIVVEQPVGNYLVNATFTSDWGAVPADNPVTKVFTVKNPGNAPLTGVKVTINGPDDSDFTLITPPAATLPARTGTTTFAVMFAPSSPGVKVAALHINSSDPDEPSFDIDLTGNGTPPIGALSFTAATYTVNEDVFNGEFNIPVKRSDGSNRRIGVKVTTANGTATAGSDYAALPANVERIIEDGVTSIDVPITIAHNTSSEANETFTVTLSNPTGGTRLGSPSKAIVTIIDASSLSRSTDTVDPTPSAISFPAAGAMVGVNTTMNVTGTAKDNKGVKRVLVSLDGVNFSDAALSVPGAPSTGYSIAVTPVTGANTLHVKTVDYSDRESVVVARSFKVLRPLAVGIVSGTFGSVTSGFTPTSFREVGRVYTITATAKAGGIFAGWSVTGATNEELGIAPLALDRPALTFIFREGVVFTANFIANPYTASVTGTYNGLVTASQLEPDRGSPGPGGEDGTPTATSTEGSFTTTVLGSGAFSGKLAIDGSVLPVTGSFDYQGRARFGAARELTQTITRPGKPSLIVQFNIGGPLGSAAPNGHLMGKVSATELGNSTIAAVSGVDAHRAYYTGLSGLFTVPDPYLTVTSAAASPSGRVDGVFTVVLPSVPLASQPVRIAGVLTPAKYPQGDGVGIIKVSKAGLVTLNATLADGTTVTASSRLSQDLRAGLFVQLYGLKGFLSAPLQLDHMQPGSDLAPAVGDVVLWSRPAISTSHYYPDGWKEVLELDLFGARYRAPTGQSVLKAPSGANLQAADADGNVSLTFSDGKLGGPLVKSANLSTTDIVTKVPASDATFTTSVSRVSGAITGNFIHTDATVSAYKAAIIQKGPNACAYGYFLTKQPVPIDYTGESGGVRIIGQP